jgi:peptidoglycan hydrolase-like protein with peptidoglycan-binding domain
VADGLDDLARLLAVPVDGHTDAELLTAVRQAERVRTISRD